jgi:hypothetical protein
LPIGRAIALDGEKCRYAMQCVRFPAADKNILVEIPRAAVAARPVLGPASTLPRNSPCFRGQGASAGEDRGCVGTRWRLTYGPRRIQARSGAKMPRQCDLAIIGTGTAASVAAHRCRDAGWRVVVVDHLPFGGTCALRGCDPKKVLVGIAETLDLDRRMRGKGIAAGAPAIDWPAMIAFKRSFTDHVPHDRTIGPRNSRRTASTRSMAAPASPVRAPSRSTASRSRRDSC